MPPTDPETSRDDQVEHSGPPRGIPPWRELWMVAWPTVLTMMSYTVMQFVDGLMVSAVGPTELNAQGTGGIFAFVPVAFAMGALSVINTFVSQNLGAKTPENGPKYAWNALWMAGIFWLALIPFGLVLPKYFAFIHAGSPRLIELESMYAQVLIFGAFLTMGSRAISHFFYGFHRPKVVFVATIIANVINIFVNWVLIFGHLGFPRLELFGAAIGTLIGTAIEFAIPMAIFLGPKLNRELHVRAAWKPNLAAMKDILRLGWPKGAQFGNEMVCWAIFMAVLVGRFGEADMAAGWITIRYMHLSFMPSLGISVAITAVVGRYLGAGDPETAQHRAWLGVRMAVIYMGVCAVAFVVFREPLVRLFVDLNPNAGDEALRSEILVIGKRLLICAAVFQVFDAIAISLSGALSGAGDTVWPGVVTIISSWTFLVGLGWGLAVLFPEWGSLGPWIGAACFLMVLGVAFIFRWRSGRWREINLLHRDDA